jgi:hypothetical protein
MEDTTYTLHIRRTGIYKYEVTIPETGATKTAATLDSTLNITLHEIVKHLTTRYLILVFADQHIDGDSWLVDSQERPQTDLERQVTFEIAQLGIAPYVQRRERHLVFELSRPLTQEQATWLDEHAGKLFDRYYIKDELEVQRDELREEACDNRKAATNE